MVAHTFWQGGLDVRQAAATCPHAGTPDAKVETLLFGTLGLPVPPIYLTVDIPAPRTSMPRRCVNLGKLGINFPMWQSCNAAARAVPGLVPFFNDQNFMSDAQLSWAGETETHVTQTLSYTLI